MAKTLQEKLDHWFSNTEVPDLTDALRQGPIESKVVEFTKGVKGETPSTYAFNGTDIKGTDCIVLKSGKSRTYYLKCLLSPEQYTSIIGNKGVTRGYELMARMKALKEAVENLARNPEQSLTSEQSETISTYFKGTAQMIADTLGGVEDDTEGLPRL